MTSKGSTWLCPALLPGHGVTNNQDWPYPPHPTPLLPSFLPNFTLSKHPASWSPQKPIMLEGAGAGDGQGLGTECSHLEAGAL